MRKTLLLLLDTGSENILRIEIKKKLCIYRFIEKERKGPRAIIHSHQKSIKILKLGDSGTEHPSLIFHFLFIF